MGRCKNQIQAKVSIKADLPNGDYELYDGKLDHYDEEKLEDNTPLKRGMTAYARTNYTKFKWEINNSDIELLVGYTGSKPKGRIIIPAKPFI